VIVTDVTEGTDGERIDGSVLSFQPGASLAKHHSHRRMTSIVEAEVGRRMMEEEEEIGEEREDNVGDCDGGGGKRERENESGREREGGKM
jgi:hypothetical protein